MQSELHIRVDNRLLHGQVVQFWIPFLNVSKLIIADDLAAAHITMRAVFRMAVPENVEIDIVYMHELKKALETQKNETTLVIVSDVFDIARLELTGLNCQSITLGNVHTSKDRHRVTDAVYLSDEEKKYLAALSTQGRNVEVQTFPGEVLKLEIDDNSGEVQWKR